MPKSASAQTLASYLTEGYWHDIGNVPHAFDTSDSNVVSVNLQSLNSAGQALARAALDAWETVADIEFRETGGSALIKFDDSASGAESYVTMSSGGDTKGATINIGTSWLSKYGTSVGSYSFQTYMHEIGHALGLGHPGEYNGGADFAKHAKYANDSWQSTVMSYFNQDENTKVDASYATVVTPMMADVIAVQSLYGAPKGGATAGNTKYGVGSDLGTYLDAAFKGSGASLAKDALTIYDESGTDSVNFSDDGKAQDVNLNGGAFSDVYGLKGNLGIAVGTTVENYSAGSASDEVTGNGAANTIRGNKGNDRIDGGSGNDQLLGGDGDDLLEGGNDKDTLKGDAGRDNLSGQGGDDKVHGGSGSDTLNGNDGRDLLEGGDDNDIMAGGGGDDTLRGGDGNDKLDGREGHDALTGGDGSDTFVFSSGKDVVTDFDNNTDTLLLDDALWGGRSLSTDQVLDKADVRDGDVVLDFGNGNTLRLDGFSKVDWLADDISFV